MSFEGKTLSGKRKTRGIDDPTEQMESFLSIYDGFYKNFESLDDGIQSGFTDKANDLLDDKNIGNTLSSGEEEEVREELDFLEKHEKKTVMDFLVSEQVIEFDD